MLPQLPSDDARQKIDDFEVLVCEGIWPKVNKFLQSLPKTRAGREAAAYLLKLCGLARLNYPLGGSLRDVITLPQDVRSAFVALHQALSVTTAHMEEFTEDVHEKIGESRAETLDVVHALIEKAQEDFRAQFDGLRGANCAAQAPPFTLGARGEQTSSAAAVAVSPPLTSLLDEAPGEAPANSTPSPQDELSAVAANQKDEENEDLGAQLVVWAPPAGPLEGTSLSQHASDAVSAPVEVNTEAPAPGVEAHRPQGAANEEEVRDSSSVECELIQGLEDEAPSFETNASAEVGTFGPPKPETMVEAAAQDMNVRPIYLDRI